MSEEKLAKESEELTEEEIAEKAKATAKEDSSDGNEDDEEEEVEESKSTKASVKKEEEDEEESDSEEDEEEVEEAVKAVVPKTKNGMLKSVYEKLNGLKKDQLAAQYETILKATDIVKEDSVEEEVESKRTKAAITAEDLNIDVKDDVEALIQGEDGLTEEFKQKASTIFEAAVQSKVLEEVNKKANEIEAQLKEDQDKSGADFKKDMSEKVDGYLTYVVEEWMKENELAIE